MCACGTSACFLFLVSCLMNHWPPHKTFVGSTCARNKCNAIASKTLHHATRAARRRRCVCLRIVGVGGEHFGWVAIALLRPENHPYNSRGVCLQIWFTAALRLIANWRSSLRRWPNRSKNSKMCTRRKQPSRNNIRSPQMRKHAIATAWNACAVLTLTWLLLILAKVNKNKHH